MGELFKDSMHRRAHYISFIITDPLNEAVTTGSKTRQGQDRNAWHNDATIITRARQLTAASIIRRWFILHIVLDIC